MKIFLILLFAASCFGQSIQEQVKKFDKPKSYAVKYDKFKLLTTVTTHHRIKATKGYSTMNMTVTAIIADNGTASFYLQFQSPLGKLLFSRDVLRVMADDDILDLGESGIGYSAVFDVTAEFSTIVKSKSVELQLARFEGKFDDKTLTALKNLYSLAN